MVEERAQVASFARFEAPRQPQQLVDVGEPALAPLQPEHVIAVATRLDGPLDQLGERPSRGRLALALQVAAKARERLTVACGEALAEIPLSAGCGERRLPDATAGCSRGVCEQRQAIPGAARERRSQRAIQRPLIEWVGQRAQI